MYIVRDHKLKVCMECPNRDFVHSAVITLCGLLGSHDADLTVQNCEEDFEESYSEFVRRR